MLVLSRKKDQRIIIGHNVTLVVVDVRGDTVQLGIDAPKEIPIYREEVYRAIQEANVSARDHKLPSLEDLGNPRPQKNRRKL